MNIFEALSQGNGQISETNITSFLSFLLNKTNECGSAFLIIFLEYLEINNNSILEINGNSLRKKIKSFNKKYSFSAIPEVRIQFENKLQILDILLTITNKSSEKDELYILIENKINKSSIKKEQCVEQLEIFSNCEDFQKNIPTYSVLITPPEKNFEEMYLNVLKNNSNSFWLSWTENSFNLKSIENLIRRLILLENNLEIAPINDNLKYILKSFVEHITNELSERSKDFNYSINGSNVIEAVKFNLKSKLFILKRFENNMIRIYDEDESELKEQVKPILRDIIKGYNFKIDIENKNTQTLGKIIIKELKDLEERYKNS